MTRWFSPYLTLVEDCEARESKMSAWEQNFVQSIREQIGRDRGLSDKQIQRLNEIWDKVTE